MRSEHTNKRVKQVRIWLVANRQLVLDSLGCLLGGQRRFQLVGATDFGLGLRSTTKVDLVVAYLENLPMFRIDSLIGSLAARIAPPSARRKNTGPSGLPSRG
jgi:hypothetical protein